MTEPSYVTDEDIKGLVKAARAWSFRREVRILLNALVEREVRKFSDRVCEKADQKAEDALRKYEEANPDG